MTTPASESASTPSTTVPQPSRIPPPVRPKAGFTRYAERLNGRLAMTAFTVVILVELVTGHGVLHWLGLYYGAGGGGFATPAKPWGRSGRSPQNLD
ncbi:MAG: hypothetical protein ACO4CG_10100 [Prochlorothrix sp.]